MTRPKYKVLWLAEKQRADGLQHKLKRWEALIPAFEERGGQVMQQLRHDKIEAELGGLPCLGHEVTRLDFEALGLALRTHARLGGPPIEDYYGFVSITLEGVPIGLIK